MVSIFSDYLRDSQKSVFESSLFTDMFAMRDQLGKHSKESSEDLRSRQEKERLRTLEESSETPGDLAG